MDRKKIALSIEKLLRREFPQELSVPTDDGALITITIKNCPIAAIEAKRSFLKKVLHSVETGKLSLTLFSVEKNIDGPELSFLLISSEEKELWNEAIKGSIPDHRILNKRLKLYSLNEFAGSGFPLWTARGVIVRDLIRNIINQIQKKHNVSMVSTPILGPTELFCRSGHLEHYSKNIFSPTNDGLILRPMTCPHHILHFQSKPRSHKDLPMWIGENAILFRNESSGGITGLSRVRQMELIDTHIFTHQVSPVIKECYQIILESFEALEITSSVIELSVRDPHDKDKFFGTDDEWERSEQEIEKTLKELGVKFKRVEGEAAFYGPKIDFQVVDCRGKLSTLSTIQLDFQLPKKFSLNFSSSEGINDEIVLVHLGIIGSLERAISHLMECHQGRLPLKISPEQLRIMTVNDSADDFSNVLAEKFEQHHIRVSVDTRSIKLAKKIAECSQCMIPLSIVVGDSEVSSGGEELAVRQFGSNIVKKMSFNEIISFFSWN